MKRFLLTLLLSAACAAAQWVPRNPSPPRRHAPDLGPDLATAYVLSVPSSIFFPYLGGVGWGMAYAGAEKKAWIVGGLQSGGFFAWAIGTGLLIASCQDLQRPDGSTTGPDQPACGIGAGLTTAGFLTYLGSTVYGLASLPGIAREERRRREAAWRARISPSLVPLDKGLAAGFALDVSW